MSFSSVAGFFFSTSSIMNGDSFFGKTGFVSQVCGCGETVLPKKYFFAFLQLRREPCVTVMVKLKTL